MIGLMSTASWYSLHLSLEVNVAAKYSDHVMLSAGVQKGWSVSFFYTRRQPFTCCAWFCYDGQVQKPLPCWVKLLNSRSKEYTCIWGFLELRVVTKRGTLRERACKIVPENCLFCCVPFITLDIIRRGFVKTCHKRVKIYLWLYLVNTPWGRSLSLTIWSSSRRRPFCRGDSSATTQTEQKTRSTSESTGPEKSSRDARLNCRNCV